MPSIATSDPDGERFQEYSDNKTRERRIDSGVGEAQKPATATRMPVGCVKNGLRLRRWAPKSGKSPRVEKPADVKNLDHENEAPSGRGHSARASPRKLPTGDSKRLPPEPNRRYKRRAGRPVPTSFSSSSFSRLEFSQKCAIQRQVDPATWTFSLHFKVKLVGADFRLQFIVSIYAYTLVGTC